MEYENQPYDFAALKGAIKEYIKREPTQEEVRIINTVLWSKGIYLLNPQAREIIEREISNFPLTSY